MAKKKPLLTQAQFEAKKPKGNYQNYLRAAANSNNAALAKAAKKKLSAMGLSIPKPKKAKGKTTAGAATGTTTKAGTTNQQVIPGTKGIGTGTGLTPPNVVVPPWLQETFDYLESLGISGANVSGQIATFLADPDLNWTDPTKPFFDPSKNPKSLFQFHNNQKAEAGFLSGLSGKEFLEQLYPLFYAINQRPGGGSGLPGTTATSGMSVPDFWAQLAQNPAFKEAFGEVAPTGLTIGSGAFGTAPGGQQVTGQYGVRTTPAWQAYSALGMPGDPTQQGWLGLSAPGKYQKLAALGMPAGGVQWNPLSGQVQGQVRPYNYPDLASYLGASPYASTQDVRDIFGIPGLIGATGDMSSYFSGTPAGAAIAGMTDEDRQRLAAVMNIVAQLAGGPPAGWSGVTPNQAYSPSLLDPDTVNRYRGAMGGNSNVPWFG